MFPRSLETSSRGDDAEELDPHKTPLTRRFLTTVAAKKQHVSTGGSFEDRGE